METRLTEEKKLESKRDISRLMSFFVSEHGSESLEEVLLHLAKKESVVFENTGIYFAGDLDEWDDPHKIVDEYHVILFGCKPAMKEDCIVFLDFQELYDYMSEALYEYIEYTHKVVKERPDFPPSFALNKEGILKSLEKLKEELEL